MRKIKVPEAMTLDEAVKRLFIEALATEAVIERALKDARKKKHSIPKIVPEKLAEVKETLRVLRMLFQMTDKFPTIIATAEDIKREEERWRM